MVEAIDMTEDNFCTEKGHEDYVKEYCQLCYSKKLREAKKAVLARVLNEIERVGLKKTSYMTAKQRKDCPELNYIILTATEFEEIRKKHVGVRE